MTAGTPKPQRDDRVADGARKGGDETPDAGDAPGEDDGPPAPDAIALEELTAENDDGAG